MITKKAWLQTRKWVVFLLAALVLSSLQGAAGLFELFGTRPILLLPFAVCFAVFHNEKNATAMALVCGALWDAASGRPLGFSSLLLLACCVAVSLLVMYLIKPNLINSLLLTAGTLAVYYSIDFVFRYLIWGYDAVWVVLTAHILPTMLYTLVVTPLLYLLCRTLTRRLESRLREA